MKVIDQNNALFSLELNLLPGRSLIDDRSERERLTFLAEFASLINFYSEHNQLTDNWTPFLLKDPVFLTAFISQTKFERWKSLYTNACLKLENESPLSMDSIDLGDSFNELFNQFMSIFIYIERWTFYMQKMDDVYDLKAYVLNKVENIFSPYFWALRAFKEDLFLAKLIKKTTPVLNHLYDPFQDTLWTKNKDKSPYWKILGLKHPIEENTADDFFHALKSTGDELFVFFHTVVTHAVPEYEKLKIGQSKYPDTTLLRGFVSLLKIQQDQLNELSKKHLEFYYRDILKQVKLFAIPDHVIICAETAKKDAAFHLPAGTLFNGGMDAEKNPIEYASQEEVTLNPAAITTAYTLSCLPQEGTGSTFSSLYFQQIDNPGTVEKEEDGTIKQWETFGGSAPPPDTEIKMAIAFASPMLLLREGQRALTLYLTFLKDIDLALLQNAVYYLSTATVWKQVAFEAVYTTSSDGSTDQKKITLTISLDTTFPPVEKFLADPDGVSSLWPMMKIEFSSFMNMSDPPVLTDLQIDVTVTGLKEFQLYNDNGLLTTKTPYQLFGPIPLQGSSFIIGSNEIFSKPFDVLTIGLDWDTLPPKGFEIYYAQYNAYLLSRYKNVSNVITDAESETSLSYTPSEPASPSRFKRFLNVLGKVFLVYWIWKLFSRKTNTSTTSEEQKAKTRDIIIRPAFSNVSFAVGFQLLTGQAWEKFDIIKEMKNTTGEPPFIPYDNPDCKRVQNDVAMLFSTKDKCALTDSSYFGYNSTVPPATPDPYIQHSVLEFTDTSTSGFMKMSLDLPKYGFGADLYAALVSEIALQNAVIIINIDKDSDDPPQFLQPAAMPFVPKLKNFSADYQASQTYDLTVEKEAYPLQCFFYSPFENYLVYDNSSDAVEQESSAVLTITGEVWETRGLRLYPSLKYKGVLFLEIENLVAADSLNIFFELNRKYGTSPGSRTINYNYLSVTGWKELKVLADDTNNFTCSGVIKVNVPLDMATESLVLPEKKYWISIGVKEDPGSFAQTSYLKTNGFDVKRSGTSYLAVTEKPWIPANTIVQTKMPVPQISTIEQPFPSQGGKAAETEKMKDRRVSNRIKTKDRAVTSEDYFRLIRQEFDDIYYSKVIYDPVKKTTEIYVVKSYDSSTDPNAFLPLVSECQEQKIESYLKERASFFANIKVSNFKIEYVKVKAVVVIKDGFEDAGVRQNIINAINIYLSPWVTSAEQQVAIDQGISDAELAALIKTIDGVSAVNSISFEVSITDIQQKKIFRSPPDQQGRVVVPSRPSALFVPESTHDIQFSPVQ